MNTEEESNIRITYPARTVLVLGRYAAACWTPRGARIVLLGHECLKVEASKALVQVRSQRPANDGCEIFKGSSLVGCDAAPIVEGVRAFDCGVAKGSMLGKTAGICSGLVSKSVWRVRRRGRSRKRRSVLAERCTRHVKMAETQRRTECVRRTRPVEGTCPCTAKPALGRMSECAGMTGATLFEACVQGVAGYVP